jgi:hypothetical protein
MLATDKYSVEKISGWGVKMLSCTVQNEMHAGWQTVMVLLWYCLPAAIHSSSSFHSNPINF